MSRRLPDALARRLNPPAAAAEQPTARHRNVAKLMARLQTRSPNLVPRKGSGGHREVWDIEDGLTVAQGLGNVASKSPGMSLAVTVLCLRWWPEYVLGPEVVRSIAAPPDGKTPQQVLGYGMRPDSGGNRCTLYGHRELPESVQVVSVALKTGYGKRERPQLGSDKKPVMVQRTVEHTARRQTYRPAMLPLARTVNLALQRKLVWSAMPEKVAKRVLSALEGGLLTQSLLHEYVFPNHCVRCHGYGEILRTRNEDGTPCPAAIVPCPVCIGQGVMARGVSRRARDLEMRTSNYHAHVQPAYDAVLGLLRHLEGRAARALVRVLGD